MIFITKSTGRGTNGLSLVPIPKVPNAYYECACSRLYYIYMNYNYFIQNTYRINTSLLQANTLSVLNSDGNISSLFPSHLNYTYTYGNLIQTACEFGYGNAPLLFATNTRVYLLTPTNIDYWVITNSSSDSEVEVIAKELQNNGNDTSTLIDSGVDYDLYLHLPNGDILSDLDNYGDFSAYISDNESIIFDFANTFYPQDSYYYTYQAKQFNHSGNAYYYYQMYLVIDRDEYITLSYGNPRVREQGNEYYSGLADGYNNGYTAGYKDGYDVGISLDSNTSNAFSYIEQTFNAIGGIMNLEIIPHVTIGLCFSIPFVILVITTIFKMLKK